MYAERDGYEIDANQELVALGMANIVGGFFWSFPIGGSFSRTAVSADSGAKSLVSCAIVGLIVTLALTLVADSFYFIPMASLASIIEMAVVNLIKVPPRPPSPLPRHTDTLAQVASAMCRRTPTHAPTHAPAHAPTHPSTHVPTHPANRARACKPAPTQPPHAARRWATS